MKKMMKKVPASKKGSLGKLPAEVRNKMGYMKAGGEKLLMKMTKGGMLDMSAPMEQKMRMGGMMQQDMIKKAMMGAEKKKAKYGVQMPKRGMRMGGAIKTKALRKKKK